MDCGRKLWRTLLGWRCCLVLTKGWCIPLLDDDFEDVVSGPVKCAGSECAEKG